MKHWSWLMLLVVAAAPGCIWTNAEVQQAPSPIEFKAAPPPPVTAEQVTEANCEELMQRLDDEVDRELYSPPSARH
jgi:hypothetical protein